MKYLILLLTVVIAASSLVYYSSLMANDYSDYIKSSLCVKEKIAAGYERSQIETEKDKCFIK